MKTPVSINAHHLGDMDVQEVGGEEGWIGLILVTGLPKPGSFTRC